MREAFQVTLSCRCSQVSYSSFISTMVYSQTSMVNCRLEEKIWRPCTCEDQDNKQKGAMCCRGKGRGWVHAGCFNLPSLPAHSKKDCLCNFYAGAVFCVQRVNMALTVGSHQLSLYVQLRPGTPSPKWRRCCVDRPGQRLLPPMMCSSSWTFNPPLSNLHQVQWSLESPSQST